MTTSPHAPDTAAAEALLARGLIQMTGRSLGWMELRLCTACGRLRGPVTDPAWEGAMEQQCDCQPNDAPRWPRHDFNMVAELCRCCCQVLLPTGSRYSLWFCRGCLRLVGQLNQRLGRYAVPIGRHSFHGGLMLSGRSSDLDWALYADRWGQFTAAMDRVADWSRVGLREVARERWPAPPAEVGVMEYLGGCNPTEAEKIRRFGAMIDYLRDG